jgi:hypothetical protein
MDKVSFDSSHGSIRDIVLPRTLNAEIPAEIGFSHIHVFDFHVDIINLSIRLLRARKFTSRSQKG